MQARARDTGFLAANRWLVLMFPNEKVRNALGMNFVPDVARLATTCKSVVISDKTWYSTEENYITAGANRVFPYKKNTNNSTGILFQFNCGADMFEKEFFDGWFGYLQNPATKQWRFYDDYAKNSEVYILLLPNHVRNFDAAIEAMYQGKVTGIRLTEAYPFRITINAGNLNYAAATEPLSIDVSMMYQDLVSLQEEDIPPTNALPAVRDTGFPVIERSVSERLAERGDHGLGKAINGFVINDIPEEVQFNDASTRRRSILEAYARQLAEYRNDATPRAIDGRVVSRPLSLSGLLGFETPTQTETPFGADLFG